MKKQLSFLAIFLGVQIIVYSCLLNMRGYFGVYAHYNNEHKTVFLWHHGRPVKMFYYNPDEDNDLNTNSKPVFYQAESFASDTVKWTH